MNQENSPPSSAETEAFYSGAVRRIVRSMLVSGVVATPAVLLFYGGAATVGFVAGGLISWFNFAWLSKGVEGLTARIVNESSRERGGAVLWRFILRYALVGIVAYAIFKGSSQAFRGFLVGLCLPVAGMLGEAAYEAHAAFRRGY